MINNTSKVWWITLDINRKIQRNIVCIISSAQARLRFARAFMTREFRFYFETYFFTSDFGIQSNGNSTFPVGKMNFSFFSRGRSLAARLFYSWNFPFPSILAFRGYYTPAAKVSPSAIVSSREESFEANPAFYAEEIGFRSFFRQKKLMQYLPIFPAAARKCARSWWTEEKREEDLRPRAYTRCEGELTIDISTLQ